MHGGIDENGVYELVDAHVLQHFLLVLLADIVAVLHTLDEYHELQGDRCKRVTGCHSQHVYHGDVARSGSGGQTEPLHIIAWSKDDRKQGAHLLIQVCNCEALCHVVLQGLQSQLLKIYSGTHVVADAILQDVTHCQHLQRTPLFAGKCRASLDSDCLCWDGETAWD